MLEYYNDYKYGYNEEIDHAFLMKATCNYKKQGHVEIKDFLEQRWVGH